jgi:hypothetical protein
MILSPKIFMCQKSMGYEKITMPKCMRERKHAKEHDAYKKEREKTMGTQMPASMLANENKIAHTLKSTFNIRERIMIKGVQKK